MRHPKPWFRQSRRAWFVEIDGRQHFLGKHPAEAPPFKKRNGKWAPPAAIRDSFYKLLAFDPVRPPALTALSVAVLCDLFLRYSETHNTSECFA